MKDLIRNNIFEKLVKNPVNILQNVSIAHEYLPAIGTALNFGIIEQWLENDMSHSPEEMAMIYFKIINLIRSTELFI
jgi:hypothetical protein